MSWTDVVGRNSVSPREQKLLYALLLLFLFLVGAVLRTMVAYNGGIWADEGAFLLVAKAPSWRAMLDFLHFHESHPPLFYALMRLWMGLVGIDDRAVLALPVLFGIAMPPAVYFVSARLFSRRIAVVATFLAAVSPALVESASQIRPYGLLPLLALASTSALAALSISRRFVTLAFYVLSTTLMLYTHNWAWLVLLGQVVAAGIVALRREVDPKTFLIRVGASWLAVAIAFAPAVSTLLYQAGHAGHGGIPLTGITDAAEAFVFAVPASVAMVFFGSLFGTTAWSVLLTIFGGLFVATLVRVRAQPVETRSGASFSRPGFAVGSQYRSSVALQFFTIVPLVSVTAAIAMLPRSDMILPRCLATVTPLVLISVSVWIVQKDVARSPTNAGLSTVLAAASLFGVVNLLESTRSNMREEAQTLARTANRTDLIIVAPVWFAASFDHYFPPSFEQIDFPNPGRTAMLDFSDVFHKLMKEWRVEDVAVRVGAARAAGRRVWLVTPRHYGPPTSPQDSVDAIRFHRASVISALRVRELESVLNREYGGHDSTLYVADTPPRYEHIIARLYAVQATSAEKAFDK